MWYAISVLPKSKSRDGISWLRHAAHRQTAVREREIERDRKKQEKKLTKINTLSRQACCQCP